MTKDTLRLIELLEKRGMHDHADQLVANWELIASRQARIEQLTQDIAEQREINENYAAAHRLKNLHKLGDTQ